MSLKTIDQAGAIFGKTVFLRVDFNVPIKNKKVLENYKIKKSLLTLKNLLEKGARVVVVSHLGRPTQLDKKFSLKPVAEELGKFLQKKVSVLPISDLAKTNNLIKKLAPGSLAVLENIRFLKGEVENSNKLAEDLAGLADIFVLDGFAVAHREAASVTGIARYLPAYAGDLLAEEIKGLDMVLRRPKKPLVVILGGIKMDTKIPVLKNLLSKADYILVGGGIVNTYLWAKGKKVGSSIVDKDFKKQILEYCAKKKVIMPVDVVVGPKDGKKARVVSVKQLSLQSGVGIFDIGPETIRLFATYIKKAKTLVWNGAMGNFEVPVYKYGTYAVAHLLAAQSKHRAFGVAGGGETVQVLQKLQILSDVDLPSTGGGAMLEYLGGKKLPGIEALKQ
jgi:phosphoglycerate kinase